MPSSAKTREGNPEPRLDQPDRKASRVSRRALLGLGALGAAARAEAQVRTPTRTRPTVVPRGEMRLLRRVTVGVTTEDVAWMNSLGYYGYLEWQLNAEAMGDPDARRGSPRSRRSTWRRCRSTSPTRRSSSAS